MFFGGTKEVGTKLMMIMADLYTAYHPNCDWVFPGGDDPQEYNQACLRHSLPRSDCLRFWTPHE